MPPEPVRVAARVAVPRLSVDSSPCGSQTHVGLTRVEPEVVLPGYSEPRMVPCKILDAGMAEFVFVESVAD